MAHYRKEIRRILVEMGYENRFSVHEEHLHGNLKYITIQDWEPDPKALELKKKIERSISERVVVCFTGPHITGRQCLA